MIVDENNKFLIAKNEQYNVSSIYIKKETRNNLSSYDEDLDGLDILKSELVNSLKLSKNIKATGQVEINSELIKLLDEETTYQNTHIKQVKYQRSAYYEHLFPKRVIIQKTARNNV